MPQDKGNGWEEQSISSTWILAENRFLHYTLKVFEDSDLIDEVLLVTGADERGWVRKTIVENYGFRKVTEIISGGKERYDSVWNGLQNIDQREEKENTYVFIHDGARPFVNDVMLQRAYKEVRQSKACVVRDAGQGYGKDCADVDGSRRRHRTESSVWMVQTPQAFHADLYMKLIEKMLG